MICTCGSEARYLVSGDDIPSCGGCLAARVDAAGGYAAVRDVGWDQRIVDWLVVKAMAEAEAEAETAESDTDGRRS